MTDTQSAGERLKDILVRAVELPRDERDAFIDREAADDPVLAQRVRELIVAWDGATTALREPTRAALVRGREEQFRGERPGDRIGAFTLAEKLGEGGFGVVFRARQESPVRRELAIKILRPGMENDAVLARFDAERQALARLAHPSIARIFDAGAAPSGLPFFAMELVEGPPITRYCDDRQLGVRDRLRLFIKVCHAVQHAHSKGIIHRDLKPTNILVADIDTEPTPKIIDFGIAKALDEPLTDVSVLTLARQMIGTPRYMPPEQASLDPAAVDTRSDVYSLGVVLYELLTGTTPLTDEAMRGSGITDLSRILNEGRFPQPSDRLREHEVPRESVARARSSDADRLARSLSGELDWITMRAIDPDPSRRYQTALAFARDVERYLSNEPVDARPASRVYLVRKFVRRNRVGVGAGAAIALALFGALGASLWALDTVQRERDTARTALDEAQGVTDFLSRMISSVDADEMGRDVRVAELLDGAADQLSSGELDASDAVKGRLHHVIGTSYWALGDWENAETQMRRAVEIRSRVHGPDSATALSTLANLASLVYERGDLETALGLSENLVERLAVAFDEHHETYMGSLGNYALMLKASGDVEGARAIQHRLIDLNRDVFGPDGDRTLGAQLNYAGTLVDLGRTDEAESIYTDSLARAEASIGHDAPTTLMIRHSLAMLYHSAGRDEEARPLMEAVLEDRRRVFGDTHPNTLMSAYNLSANALHLGDADRAKPLLLEVLAACPRHIPPHHPVVLYTLTNLATVYDEDTWASASPGTAEKVVEVINLARRVRLPIAQRNAFAMTLATIHPVSIRDPDAAIELATGICEEGETAGDPFLYGYLDTLSVALEAGGRLGDALAAQERAVALCPSDDQDAMSELSARLDALRQRVAAGGGPN